MGVKWICAERFVRLFATLAGVLLLSSCVAERDESCPPPESRGEIKLNLTLFTGNLATRAGEAEHPAGTFDTDGGTAAERYINPNDLSVVILDQDGKYIPTSQPDQMQMVPASGQDVRVTVVIQREEALNIRVLVLANWNSMSPSGDYLTQMEGVPSLEGLYADAGNFNFDYTSTSADGKSWKPEDKSAGIPMVGLSEPVAVPEPQYTFVPELDLGQIQMLRSLAKVEIVNQTPQKDQVVLTNATLSGYNAYGRYVPDGTTNSAWNKEATQVRNASLPNPPAGTNLYVENELIFATFYKEVTTSDETDPNTYNRTTLVAYIPEMDFVEQEGVYPKITVSYQVGGDSGSEPMTNEIEFATYVDGKPDQPLPALLRNHNYRFNIISAGPSANLDFVIETPWIEDDDGNDNEWGYEDVRVEFDSGKLFAWTNIVPKAEGVLGSYFEEDNDSIFDETDPARRTVIITPDNWLEGSFRLTQPTRSTWTIALYGDDDTLNDQFRIDLGEQKQMLDADGNPIYEKDAAGNEDPTKPVMTTEWTPGTDAQTGKVGDEVLFRIIPIGPNNTPTHDRARIVMTCQTFDDQVIEVNLPYIIKEQKTEDMPIPKLETGTDYYYVKQYYSGFGSTGDEAAEASN